MRLARWGAALFLAAAIAGCSTAPTSSNSGPLTVYLSVPLHGPRAAEGRLIAHGAREALAAANPRAGNFEVALKVLDDSGGGPRWSLVATGADARRATEDASAIAYIGELDPEATRTSAAITNLAEIPQVLLGAAPPGLSKKNLVISGPVLGARGARSGRLAIGLVLRAVAGAGKDGGDRATVLDRLQKATAGITARPPGR